MHVFTEFAPLSLYPLSTCYNRYHRHASVGTSWHGWHPIQGKREYSQMLHATESASVMPCSGRLSVKLNLKMFCWFTSSRSNLNGFIHWEILILNNKNSFNSLFQVEKVFKVYFYKMRMIRFFWPIWFALLSITSNHTTCHSVLDLQSLVCFNLGVLRIGKVIWRYLFQLIWTIKELYKRRVK